MRAVRKTGTVIPIVSVPLTSVVPPTSEAYLIAFNKSAVVLISEGSPELSGILSQSAPFQSISTALIMPLLLTKPPSYYR